MLDQGQTLHTCSIGFVLLHYIGELACSSSHLAKCLSLKREKKVTMKIMSPSVITLGILQNCVSCAMESRKEIFWKKITRRFSVNMFTLIMTEIANTCQMDFVKAAEGP